MIWTNSIWFRSKFTKMQREYHNHPLQWITVMHEEIISQRLRDLLQRTQKRREFYETATYLFSQS